MKPTPHGNAGKKKTLTPAEIEQRRAAAKNAGRPLGTTPSRMTLWRRKKMEKS